MSGSATDFGDEGGAKLRSSRALAQRHREEQDRRAAARRAQAAMAAPATAIVDDPDPAVLRDRDPQTDLTMLEAEACGLVTREQLGTLTQCHGTPEHAVQHTRILEVLQERYNLKRLHYPRCAPGPLLPGPNGLLIPAEIRDRALATRVRVQLDATAMQRELRRHERAALRALRRNGIHNEQDTADAAALERARLKRLSKGAKRARAVQAMLASARRARESTAARQEVAC